MVPPPVLMMPPVDNGIWLDTTRLPGMPPPRAFPTAIKSWPAPRFSVPVIVVVPNGVLILVAVVLEVEMVPDKV